MAVTRRTFLVQTALAGGAAFVAPPLLAQARPEVAAPVPMAQWIDGSAPAHHEGTTWGMAWPRGTMPARSRFAAQGASGSAVPLQSWPTATWPDGSLKWTAHAVPAGTALDGALRIAPGAPLAPPAPITARERDGAIEIASGPLRWVIPGSGPALIASASRDGQEVLRDLALVATAQDGPDDEADETINLQRYESEVASAAIEQAGPVRAVVRLDGHHRGGERQWLPFTTRLYFHAGSDAVRVVHSFIFDGDEQRDFIRGLGVQGSVPMRDQAFDRHVRLAGQEDGVWGEAVQSLTGLRRNPGEAFREAQVAGRAVPPLDQMPANVRDNLQFVPQWGDFTLSQPNADGFTIRKRTEPGHGWIDVDGGERAKGLGYIGGPSGGVAFGQGDFWQRFPVRLDIRDARTDMARFTAWYHSPEAPAMDLRFYHADMGMDDYVSQNRGLEITYEDFEPGWGTPRGIARTTEFMIWALPATPTRERFAQMAQNLAAPPRLMPTPDHVHAAGVFGDWSLPDRSTPARAAIEQQNDFLLRFYRDQVEERRWYGFWNYGDWMHSYDPDRHVWKYDIGGFAWANSELSPDLWLWYSYLRSGDPQLFRLAEAMSRHTGEVDVYHLGPFRGLGTRHGVQHWADSSKQPRVSTAAYRRIYYYLTADERTGDLLREAMLGEEALTRVDISRKVNARPDGSGARPPEAPQPEGAVNMSFGTTWCSLCAAWLTEWERTGDTRWRDRIVAGMTSLAALPKQWFAGGAYFDLESGRFIGPGDEVSISHLNAVFGAVEVNSELLSLLDVPAYREAWLDYCATYNASEEAFLAQTGAPARGRNLKQGHSRLTAYAAHQRRDPALAQRAWAEFLSGEAGLDMGLAEEARPIAGPQVLRPVTEVRQLSTNGASQWGLAAIQNLALVGEYLPPLAP